MSGSERINAYSEAVKNFDLIYDLPPKNTDIHQLTFDQKVKFEKLCSKDSFIVPIVYNNQISHFKINKKVLKRNIIFSNAKEVYRNQYLRNTHNTQEKATFIIINITFLMFCILMSDSQALLLILEDEFLLNIIAASSYLSLTLVFLTYYLAVSFIVSSIDVVDDITLGVIEKHPTMIGSKV